MTPPDGCCSAKRRKPRSGLSPGRKGLITHDRDDVRVERPVRLCGAADLDALSDLRRGAARIDHRALMQVNRAIPIGCKLHLHVEALEIGNLSTRLIGEFPLRSAYGAHDRVD